MKKVLPITLTFILLFLFSNIKGQNTAILKSFINKNNFALRSVQKHTIRLADDANTTFVKSILKLHLISIKLYETNIELSKQAAYQARMESIHFLQKNSNVPLETYKLNNKEKALFGTPRPIDSINNLLSGLELKTIEDADLKNPESLNSFITNL